MSKGCGSFALPKVNGTSTSRNPLHDTDAFMLRTLCTCQNAVSGAGSTVQVTDKSIHRNVNCKLLYPECMRALEQLN